MKLGILRFDNQVIWARQYLVWVGLLDDSKRGVWTLSQKGQTAKLDHQQSHSIFLKWVEIHQRLKKEKLNL